MDIVNLILLFVIGVCVGSFINVLIDRLPINKSLLSPPSRCEGCDAKIPWYHLFPVVSYIFLIGKCSSCGVGIPFRILVVELIVGFLFAFSYFSLFDSLPIVSFMFLLVIFSLLVSLFFIDWQRNILPDKILIVLFFAITFYHLSLGNSIVTPLIVGLALFVFFLVIFFITGMRGLGFGDVKFSFLIGYFLEFPDSVASLYISFVVGALISIFLIILKRKKLRGDTVAFGPFLILGIFIVYFWSEQLYALIFQFAS